MNKTSYTEVTAVAVIAAAESWLKRRAERITREREELIVERMKKRRGPPWRRRNLTRDEAIESLKNEDGVWGGWWEIENTGYFWAQRAEELKQLAEVSDTAVVLISAEDAAFLQRHREFLEAQQA